MVSCPMYRGNLCFFFSKWPHMLLDYVSNQSHMNIGVFFQVILVKKKMGSTGLDGFLEAMEII